ncbi:hypothetical protein MRX96_026222 [Rhipicephalus microplus]
MRFFCIELFVAERERGTLCTLRGGGQLDGLRCFVSTRCPKRGRKGGPFFSLLSAVRCHRDVVKTCSRICEEHRVEWTTFSAIGSAWASFAPLLCGGEEQPFLRIALASPN